MVTIRTSISMTETCISATLAGIGYYSSGTWWENVEEWENLRKEKKNAHNEYLWAFLFWLWLKMQKNEWTKKKKKNCTGSNTGVSL
jgi:hypothetical protein